MCDRFSEVVSRLVYLGVRLGCVVFVFCMIRVSWFSVGVDRLNLVKSILKV